ncbi:hypothetical protein BH11PSE7_BH11PSE7_22900 [soil metagenome]
MWVAIPRKAPITQVLDSCSDLAALLAAMPQEHERALGAWQAELAEWPQLVMSAHGSARALAGALPGLVVDAARMRANVEAVRASLPKAVAQEWFSAELVQHAARVTRAQLARWVQDEAGQPPQSSLRA